MDAQDRPTARGRPLLLVLAWVATAAIAIAISSWAVGVASRQVTDPIPPTALTEVTRSVSPAPSADPSPSPAGLVPSLSGTPLPSTAAVTTRTVTAVGGRASFRFAGEQVTLEWATPSAGFEVDVEGGGTSDLRVRFRADDHESRIFASAGGSSPSTQVEERPDGDGD